MPEDSKPSSFWNSLAGVITAIAALITAVGGVVALLHRGDDRVEPPSDSTPPVASPSKPLVPPDAAVSTPLQDGTYSLFTYTAHDSTQKNGILLKLQQVSSDRFLADLRTPAEVGYTWSGELRRVGDDWTVTVRSYTPGNQPWAGGPDEQPGGRFNPAGSGYRITVTGPLVTFQNQTYKYVWRRTE